MKGHYLCLRCASQENIDGLIESQSRENWRNKTVSQENKDKLKFIKLDTITPAIVANNKRKLSIIKWDDVNIEITWACPFDAIFQLVLSAAVNSHKFFNNVVLYKSGDNLFMNLIQDMKETRTVSSRILLKRFQILKSHFPLEEYQLKSGKCKSKIKCDDGIRDMYVKLFENIPSFTEEISCDSGSIILRESHLLFSLASKTFMTGDASRIEEEIMDSQSCESGCITGNTMSKLRVSGDHLCFELCSGFDTADKVMLADIPSQMRLFSMSETFQLVGIIHVDPPYRGAREHEKSMYSLEGIGHYVTFCWQKDEWHSYDIKHESKPPTTLVHPCFVMYIPVT